MKKLAPDAKKRLDEANARHAEAGTNLLDTIHEVSKRIDVAKYATEDLIALYNDVGGHERLVKRLTQIYLDLDGLPRKLHVAWSNEIYGQINASQASVDIVLAACLDGAMSTKKEVA